MAHETLGNIGSYISYDESEVVLQKEDYMQQQMPQMGLGQPSQQQQGVQRLASFPGQTWLSQNWMGMVVGAGLMVALYWFVIRKMIKAAK